MVMEMQHKDRTRSESRPVVRIWANRNFTIFMAGSIPACTTQWMQRVGMGWIAWELTHSPNWLGIIAAADLGPMLLLAPFAGALTDRSKPMVMLRAMQSLMCLQAVLLMVFTQMDWLTIYVLFYMSLATGIIQPFFSASRQSILPNSVPRSELSTAIAMDSALFQLTRFIGPALASLMIPAFGVLGTFQIHTLGSCLFLVSMLFMNVTMPERPVRVRRSLVRDIGEGFAYVGSHKGIWPVFLLLTVVSIFIRPVQEMLPGFAGDIYHSDAVGLAYLNSAVGIGAMLSASIVAYRGRITGLTDHAVMGTLGLSIATLGFVVTDWLWLGVIFSALIGFTINTMSTSISALVQSAVHDDMRGRVVSLYVLVFRGTPAIGSLLVGISSDFIGLRWAFVISALICFLAWLVVLPRRRRIAAALEVER